MGQGSLFQGTRPMFSTTPMGTASHRLQLKNSLDLWTWQRWRSLQVPCFIGSADSRLCSGDGRGAAFVWQRDRCPTNSAVAWGKRCKQFIPETSNRCVHPEVPTGSLTEPLWPSPPPPRAVQTVQRRVPATPQGATVQDRAPPALVKPQRKRLEKEVRKQELCESYGHLIVRYAQAGWEVIFHKDRLRNIRQQDRWEATPTATQSASDTTERGRRLHDPPSGGADMPNLPDAGRGITHVRWSPDESPRCVTTSPYGGRPPPCPLDLSMSEDSGDQRSRVDTASMILCDTEGSSTPPTTPHAMNEGVLVRRGVHKATFWATFDSYPCFLGWILALGWVGGWDGAIWDDSSSCTCPFPVWDMDGPLSLTYCPPICPV